MFRIICLIAAKGTVLVIRYTHFIHKILVGYYDGVSSIEVDAVWFQMYICLLISSALFIP